MIKTRGNLLFVVINIALIYLCLCNIVSAESEEIDFLDENKIPNFESIGREEGLSNLSVSSIIQDNYGFLWMGTQGGLNRYDGKSIVTYRNDPFTENGLIDNLIQTMCYDEIEHEIWIGTYQGLSCYNINEDRFKNYSIEDGLSNSLIMAIAKDANGFIWLGTKDGLNRFDPVGETFTVYPVPGGVIRSLYVDRDENVYIGTLQGLFLFNTRSESLVKLKINLPSPFVMTVHEFDPGYLTLGLWDGGIVIYNIETHELSNLQFGKSNVYTVTKTKDGTLWIGTWGDGLFAYKNGTTYSFAGQDNKTTLTHPVVYSLLQDESDILWIGTNGGGLNFINPRKDNFLLYNYDPDNSNSLSSGKINTIFQDSKSRLWISVYNQGINVIDPKRTEVVKLSSELKNSFYTDSIRVIKEFNERIILGTDRGIGYYDYDKKRYEPWKLFQNMYIYDIEIISDTEIWIGTASNGTYYYNLEENEIVNYRQGAKGSAAISDNQVYDIMGDNSGRIWIATNNGLNMKEKTSDRFETFYSAKSDKSQLATNAASVLFEDSMNRIWIGLSDGGLARYNEDSHDFTSFTELDGLSNNTVESILESDNGKLWIGTHNGISVFDPESSEIFVLSPRDGIGGYEFSKGALKTESTLYLGGAHGVIGVPSHYENKSNVAPKLYITGIDLYDKSIDESEYIYNNKQYIVESNEDYIKFSFIALEYDLLNRVNYYFKLDGYDSEYISSNSNNLVSYSHLPPGNYTFNVYVKRTNEEATKPVQVFITVKAPWYKTIYAYIGMVLIFILLLFLIIRVRESFIVKKKNNELASVNGKLEEANESLKNLSHTDGLTGAYNHRYLNEHLEEHLELAKRNSHTYISILMIDIDDFKDVNDQYGHIVGDKLLIEICHVIESVLPRKTDILARYGGDEFIVMLYDTKIHGALIVAQRIRRAVEECKVELSIHDETQLVEIGTTTSIGVVSSLITPKVTREVIIQRADDALYTAKDEGKNRVVIYDHDEVLNNIRMEV